MGNATRRIGGSTLLRYLLGVVGAVGCASSDTPVARKTVLQPLEWVVEDILVTLRFDRFGDSDVVQPACDSSGIWALSLDGGKGTLRSSPMICHAVFNATAFDLAADGTTLVYADGSRDGRITRMRLDSAHSEVVLEDSCLLVPGPLAVNWSRGEIAVGRDCGRKDAGGVWLVRLADSTMRPLVDGSFDRRLGGMSWNREGSQLAFDFENPNASTRSVVVVRRDSTSVAELGFGRDPAWSPNGLEIALVKASEGDSFQELQIVTLGTGTRRVVATSNPSHRGAANWAPAIYGPLVWSPTGTRIAFSGDCGVAVASVHGQKLEWIANGGGAGGTRCR